MRAIGFGVVAVALISLGWTSGCGGGAAGTVNVSGLVTIDGQPLSGASVNFVSPTWQASGLTDDQGRYTLVGKPGEYKVTISKIEGTEASADPNDEDAVLATMSEFEGGGSDKPLPQAKQLIPGRYSDPSQSTLSFTVPNGGTDEANFTNLTSG